MKAYWGSEGIAPRTLNLGIRLRWVVNFTSQPLYPQRKSRWYTLDRRLGGPQSWSGRGDEKNYQPLPGLETPIIQPEIQCYTTELSWILVLCVDSYCFSATHCVYLYLNRNPRKVQCCHVFPRIAIAVTPFRVASFNALVSRIHPCALEA
jgi:hypothetical protein